MMHQLLTFSAWPRSMATMLEHRLYDVWAVHQVEWNHATGELLEWRTIYLGQGEAHAMLELMSGSVVSFNPLDDWLDG